jgi:putative transposase
MGLPDRIKRHRYPSFMVSHAVWMYHRFNLSYRDIQEELAFRGIIVSHESIRSWCLKFARHFREVIRKRERKPTDKWHLDEMMIKINGDWFILWRAVDSEGHELDVLVQKRRNKKAAIRFFKKLLGFYLPPRVIVTDKLKSYRKPIKSFCPKAEHRSHKGLNNRVENSHQPTRRKEKCLIKFKSPKGVQNLLSLMGKIRNIFSVNVGRYKKPAHLQRLAFEEAKSIWDQATQSLKSV